MSSVNELLNYFVVNEDKDDVAKGGEGAKSRAEQLERERQKENEKAVVRRYFPGQKPHYAKNAKEDDEEDGDEDDEEEEDEDTLFARNDTLTEYLQKQGHAPRRGDADKEPGSDLPSSRGHVDSRYERLKNKSIKGDERERITRRVREVKVINNPEEVKEEGLTKARAEEGEEADNYEKYFSVGQEEVEQVEDEEEEEADDEDESSNSSEDESDDQSDDENYMNGQDGSAPMKHEYVFKMKRKTLLETFEKEKSEKQLLKDEETEKKKIELEKKEKAIEETVHNDIMIEQMKNQENNLFSSDENFEDDDDEGEPNEEEYELWKLRHLNRLKRDELERRKHELVQNEISERRKMTDREIMEQNKLLPHKEKKKKKKMLFMQKYYHKGGFFQDLFEEGKEEIYTRDYNEPVYEDKVDRENLPKVLRVRRGNFGKQGQTKYTHLLDNDTSRKDSLWANRDMEDRRARRKEDVFDRPTYRKG
ncbi:hypothetical protein AK88_00387 [Plasmodium fragile]|uniref:Micro-fibrillar-associated protein 1 C-terminal domain-containing protein n=1 Tax=Plasmodium fragile TaxID=5857 RepID=A0A0D9QU78_PLAFR|nr:uncharacterized protein AK88_00387 [Plasmodium fragile]KJP89931.1 hypothetical protein AK88_00387 [Plasmodium fragile]